MISFFRAPIRNIAPQAQVTVQQIYKYITSDYAKLVTERLRSIADHGEARRYKAEMFDYVTFSGHFRTRQTSGLIEHSGFLCFDIDKIESEDDLQNIKAQLITDEKLHTVLLFRSPSGNGLKWVVEVPDRYWLCQCQQSTDNGQQSINGRLQITDYRPLRPTDSNSVEIAHTRHSSSKLGSALVYSQFSPNLGEELDRTKNSYVDTVTKNHKLLYERIREYLLDEYGIVTDHTSDIPRPCYLPYDDDAFYDEPTFRANPAHPFLADARSTVDSQQTTALTDTACRVPTFDDTEAVVREIEKRRIDITGDYLNWIRIALALASKHGVTGEEYFHRISQFHHGYDPQEAHKVYTSCLRNNSGAVTIGTIVYLIHNS